MSSLPFAFTAEQLSSGFRVPLNEVQALASSGELIELPLGMFDGAWFAYLLIGRRRAAMLKLNIYGAACVALGWAGASKDRKEAGARLIELFERNGMTAQQASEAVSTARAARSCGVASRGQ